MFDFLTSGLASANRLRPVASHATSFALHTAAAMLVLALTFSNRTAEHPRLARSMVLLAPPTPKIQAPPRAARLKPERQIPIPLRFFRDPVKASATAPPRELSPVPALHIQVSDIGRPLLAPEQLAQLEIPPPPPLRTNNLAPLDSRAAASPKLLSSSRLPVLRSSGFEQVADETQSRRRAPPTSSGTFDDATRIPLGVQKHRALLAAEPPFSRSVEILSKPRPAYTEEARRQRIEGEVLLEILFAASGQLRVIGTVRGLGYGLNESAIAAAEAIRYRPAERAGMATDSTAVVHIVFQLAY